MHRMMRNYGESHSPSCVPACLCCCTLLGLLLLGACVIPLLSADFSSTLSVILSSVSDEEVSTAFADFKTEYGKEYASEEEEAMRKKAFAFNYKRIVEYNKQAERTVTLGINQFADIPDDEFDKRYLSYPTDNPQCTVAHTRHIRTQPTPQHHADIDINWADRGFLPMPKDQGNCGSCWTFAATSVIETIYALRNGKDKLTRLAEQQLVDCCVTKESRGCYGGLTSDAFTYVTAKGLATTVDYPYHAANERCKDGEVKPFFKIDGYVNITFANREAMEKVIMERTIAVGVSASYAVFRFYKTGVITTGCFEYPINHGVVVAGAGTLDNEPFWLVRNSWGANWGDHGYLRISRSLEKQKLGVCGIASCPQYVKYKET